ncbi:hypothetical protein ACEPAF_40 [Sanghuangporus sanghuang]
MSFSYAQVANAMYRRGPTPSTPALSRSGSSASSSTFRNVTNTTPGAGKGAVPDTPMVSQSRASAKGIGSAPAVAAVAQDASSTQATPKVSQLRANRKEDANGSDVREVAKHASSMQAARLREPKAQTHTS